MDWLDGWLVCAKGSGWNGGWMTGAWLVSNRFVVVVVVVVGMWDI